MSSAMRGGDVNNVELKRGMRNLAFSDRTPALPKMFAVELETEYVRKYLLRSNSVNLPIKNTNLQIITLLT